VYSREVTFGKFREGPGNPEVLEQGRRKAAEGAAFDP
jgi:hypothetical protein